MTVKTCAVQVLLRELVAITGDITVEELHRAKTQLKSMLLMNLESRPVIFEGKHSMFIADNNDHLQE